jgi:hypothetical protein
LRGAGRGAPTAPRSIVELLDQRVLDPELAALIWLLLEAHAPLLVAGAPGSGKTTLLDAALDLLPPLARTVPLEGAIEDFAWLPEAPELGWRPPRRLPGAMATERPRAASPESTVLLLSELSTATERDTWGPRARIAVRALSLGYAMAATIPAERLEEVFERLRRPPVMLTDDELSRLGVVIVIREVAPPGGGEARRRVVAAHYVRPVVRDAHGHVQRMAPAVLAAYESRTDELEHFAWGIVPELAVRVGRSASDFEREQARRAEFLQGLVAAGVTDPSAVRLALASYLGCDPAEVD